MVGLRVPHASAELKKLRNNGYVVGDKEAGIRGAVQRLTDFGRQLLREDELAAFAKINLDEIPANCTGCVLARDKQMLLLAYRKKPQNALIPLPKRALGPLGVADSLSSGNEGVTTSWAWAVQNLSRQHWVDGATIRSIDPPIEVTDKNTISDWVIENSTWVILRVKLLEADLDISLSSGSWIKDIEGEDWPNLPKSCVGGDWNLGIALPSSISVSPVNSVISPISSRLGRGLILRSARKGAWVLADLDLLGMESTPLPLEVLIKWIEVAHPRLQPDELLERHNWLRSELLGRGKQMKRTAGQQATWQRFSKAWPKTIWRQKSPPMDSMWDLRGMDSSASFTLIEWALDNSPVSVVVQWPHELDDDIRKLKKISKHPNLRLLITSNWVTKGESLILDVAEAGMPKMEIGFAGKTPLPFTLTNSPAVVNPMPVIELPQNAESILRIKSELIESGIVIPSPLPDPSSNISQSTLFACLLYPEGNTKWANSVEVANPLAAWISTPTQDRADRWERIHGIIGVQWIELLDPADVENKTMSKYAMSNENWSRRAAHEMQSRIHKNPDILLDLHPVAFGHTDSWYAGVALSVAPLLSSEQAKDIVSWAWPVWSANPEHEMEHVLPCLENLSLKGFVSTNWREKVLVDKLPLGHSMHMWKELCFISKGGHLEEEDSLLIISKLPWRWWSAHANELLFSCLQSAKGRELLAELDLPWAAILFQPVGNSTYSPCTDVAYYGCSADLEIILSLHRDDLSRRGGKGSDHLLDVHDSLLTLTNNSPPEYGRTHPLVGWLIQPLHLWPPLDFDYWEGANETISQALLSRKSGYHDSLLTSQQQRIVK